MLKEESHEGNSNVQVRNSTLKIILPGKILLLQQCPHVHRAGRKQHRAGEKILLGGKK